MAVLSRSEEAENGTWQDRPRPRPFGVYVIVVLHLLRVSSFPEALWYQGEEVAQGKIVIML